MRAILLIAVASVATQLPARDVAPASPRHSADGDQCHERKAEGAVRVANERTFQSFSVSRSVI